MVFASPIFLFLFLPLTLAAYFAVPRALAQRRAAGREPRLLRVGRGALPRAGRSARSPFNYAIGGAIGRAQRPAARAGAGWPSASRGNLAVLAVFKYANFVVDNVNALAPVLAHRAARRRARSRCRSASRSSRSTRSRTSSTSTGATRRRRANLPRLRALHPALPAAHRRADHPLPRHRRRSSRARVHGSTTFAYGVRRFVLGLGKKVLIANTLAAAGRPDLRAAGRRSSTAPRRLARARLLHAADLLRLLRLLGHGDRPRRACSASASSRTSTTRTSRAAITRVLAALAHLAVDLVPRLPLHPARRQPASARARAYANLVIVFFLCGLWHGASWTFVRLGRVARRCSWSSSAPGCDRLLARLPARCAHVYALLVVMGGWVLFRCETLPQARALLRGAGRAAAPAIALRRSAVEYLDPLVVAHARWSASCSRRRSRGAIGAWRDRVGARAGRAARVALGADVALARASCSLLSTAFLAAGTYNPFIYFRF